jgi:hypothetical protein
MQHTTRPEWLRPKHIPKYFGIGRSKAYELIADGKIKSVSLRQRGQKHGTRLVSYDSLANYLESISSGGEAIQQRALEAAAEVDGTSIQQTQKHHKNDAANDR